MDWTCISCSSGGASRGSHPCMRSRSTTSSLSWKVLALSRMSATDDHSSSFFHSSTRGNPQCFSPYSLQYSRSKSSWVRRLGTPASSLPRLYSSADSSIFSFGDLLGLAANTGGDDDWLGIWDGSRFLFQTLRPPPPGSSWLRRKLHGILNSLLLLKRYGLSLLKMDSFVQEMLQKFMLYYNGFESRPVFDNVEEMLKWSGLYGLTRRTLEEELFDAGLNSQTISELVTVITRINYGQSVSISGLAGAVSLAGSESGLWAVKGGNWQLAAGLLKTANATLHLQEGIDSISDAGDYYVLTSNKGHEYNCKVTIVATPLDEVNITFIPPISIPPRKMQHTHATFVRGLLNPKFFGLSSVSDIPELIGTVELPDIPFSCISVLKKYSEDDMTYKMFSRVKLDDGLLDEIFSKRKETIRIDWPAYPHYQAPEDFAPIILDGKHLYYVNTFESAASAMETGAVAAENVARLIIPRLPLGLRAGRLPPHIKSFADEEESRRVDL